MGKVIAVVVTYNRQKLLEECITALRKQTRKPDAILVVNNGSTDNTEQWLSTQPDLQYITQSNVGSAGGFNTGIKKAFRANYTWTWLMDDDGYPKEDALEKLLVNSDEELKLRNCAVINKADKKSFVWKTKHYKTIDEVNTTIIENVSHPFNGTLLHRKIVERVGLPKEKLFLWGDETEYYFRIIKKNAIPFCTISNSIHYHPATAHTYKHDWEYKSAWKMYYYVRNRFSILKTKYSASIPLALVMYLVFLVMFAGTIIVFQKTNKWRKLAFLVWPAFDAIVNNFTASPELILTKLEQPPYLMFSSYVTTHIRFAKFLFQSSPVNQIADLNDNYLKETLLTTHN